MTNLYVSIRPPHLEFADIAC